MDPKRLNALVHDREAASYDDRFLISYDRGIGREVKRELSRAIGRPPRASRALDVACGTGYLAIGMASAGIADRVEACDLSVAMIERTRENAARAGAAVGLTAADAERLPYATDSFDLVVARGALHHLPDPLAALVEWRRVLRPGGTAVVLAEPTRSGERQVAAVVGLAVRAVEARARLARRAPDPSEAERKSWEIASMAANLRTFLPQEIAALAERAGFEVRSVGTASLAWILVLGLNYYLVGETRIARSRPARGAARVIAGGAAAFDRLVSDRVLPPAWRHTIRAVLR
ncbi:MAG: class I SAM-dependent methyltransferase [Acidobacteria bacterium]|nr:class I SAM-dependent methyltransferase [Acidobacteriota bacterium]